MVVFKLYILVLWKRCYIKLSATSLPDHQFHGWILRHQIFMKTDTLYCIYTIFINCNYNVKRIGIVVETIRFNLKNDILIVWKMYCL